MHRGSEFVNIQMIGISNCPKSQYYSSICIPAWESLGYKINWFEASTPETLRKDYGDVRNGELKFGNLYSAASPNGREFTDTEISVWYSHYRLWKHCVEIDSPIHIIEHDSYPHRNISDFSHMRSAYFGYFPKSKESGGDGFLAVACGYYITPEFARVLLNPPPPRTDPRLWTKTWVERSIDVNHEISINVDGYIFYYGVTDYVESEHRCVGHHECDDVRTWYKDHFVNFCDSIACCFQLYSKDIGTTITHNTHNRR